MIVLNTIHAGETPLFSDIVIEQTGPMQLTVRAGRFRDTGEARVFDASMISDLDQALANNLAELIPETDKVRIWLQDANGNVVKRSRTYTIMADSVFNLTSDPDVGKVYWIELGTLNGVPEILCKSQLMGELEPNNPVGWQVVQMLTDYFVVPAGITDISDIEIRVFTVLTGFPPGMTPTFGPRSEFRTVTVRGT